MKNLETLRDYVNSDYLTDKQAEILLLIINKDLNKGSMLNIIFDNDKRKTNKIDTAYPIGITYKFCESFGGQNMPNFAFSYLENNHGELINVDRLFLSKLYNEF